MKVSVSHIYYMSLVNENYASGNGKYSLGEPKNICSNSRGAHRSHATTSKIKGSIKQCNECRLEYIVSQSVFIV